VSLFWRTFSLLALLLAACLLAWGVVLQALELEPRATQQARQLASLVQLARASLRQTDGSNRAALLKSLDQSVPTRVRPREATDRVEPLDDDRFSLRVLAELRARLGPDVIVARAVNGEPGLGWTSGSSAIATGCRPPRRRLGPAGRPWRSGSAWACWPRWRARLAWRG
jgi:two-component system osmolarity sensor histidine kinase EnvZ